MQIPIDKMPQQLIDNKIKVILFSLGFNEKYTAFEYTANIISHMIRSNSETFETYSEAIKEIMEKYKITKNTINNGIKQLSESCTNALITSKSQYHLSKYSVLNRIRVLRSYILENF